LRHTSALKPIEDGLNVAAQMYWIYMAAYNKCRGILARPHRLQLELLALAPHCAPTGSHLPTESEEKLLRSAPDLSKPMLEHFFLSWAVKPQEIGVDLFAGSSNESR
jgi:hypothetical protein